MRIETRFATVLDKPRPTDARRLLFLILGSWAQQRLAECRHEQHRNYILGAA